MSGSYSLLLTFFFYVLSALTALFWGVFLVIHRRKSAHSFYFGVIFLVIGLLYLRNSFVRLPVMEACDIYSPLSYFILILIAPFTIFYLYHVINKRLAIRRKLMHFIPFLFCGIVWIILKASRTPELPFCYSLDELLAHADQYPLYVGFFFLLISTFIVQVITYFSIALAKLSGIGRQYKSRGISRRPVIVLTMMDILFLVYPMVCLFFMTHKNTLSHGGAGFNLYVALVITAISVMHLHLKLPLKTFPKSVSATRDKVSATEKAHEARRENDTERQLAEKIAIAFEMKEMYRQPHLRLQDLAAELGTNRTYLSDCINKHFGCNFNQLVISYRINAAKELLLNTGMSIQKIIDEVGFNTRSSFYKAFKEKVSETMSPIDWRKKIKENSDIPQE